MNLIWILMILQQLLFHLQYLLGKNIYGYNYTLIDPSGNETNYFSNIENKDISITIDTSSLNIGTYNYYIIIEFIDEEGIILYESRVQADLKIENDYTVEIPGGI